MQRSGRILNPAYYIDKFFHTVFFWIGKTTSQIPVVTLVLAVALTLICAIGITKIQIESSPQKLWVPDDSETVQQKNYFDQQFSPFFRVEQLIVTSKNQTDDNIVTHNALLELATLEERIRNITIHVDDKALQLRDLCFTPIPSKGCIVQTVTGYWQNSVSGISADQDPGKKLFDCIQKSGLDTRCMDSIGIPLYYKQVIGQGVFENKTATAKAFLTTFLLNNDEQTAKYAMLWEQEYAKIAKQPTQYINVYYSSERAIQDELDRETTGDIATIAISYVAMFVYVALSLGQLHPIRSRILLGFAGIIIVIMSVVISAGICCALGVKATLIIMEVIPFLILAIGVDNMFIMANTIDTINDPNLSVPDRVGKMLGKVGASMTLASMSEFLAFMLGALTKMPAVQAFCVFAGVAVLANFILQITAFVALLSLDVRRRDSFRLELEPMIRARSLTRDWISIGKMIEWFMKKILAPVVTFPLVSVLIVILFFAASGVAIFGATHLKQGLDQTTALPSDSHMVAFFYKQREFLDIGPPVYFVTKQVNYSDPTVQAKLFDSFDMVARTEYIDRGSVQFWLDDFSKWAATKACSGHSIDTRTIPAEFFVDWLKEFLAQDQCCKVHGQITPMCGFKFRNDIKFDVNDTQVITSTRMLVQTTTLRTQADFINSMKAAFYTSNKIQTEEFQFYPYSIYYIFFAQYMYLPEVAALNIMIALGAVVIVTLVLLTSPISSIYILLVLLMIDIDLMGIMAVWDIYVNAVSVVNLVMSIGISVEFCVHIAKSFLTAKGSHRERATHALIHMGSSVVSGITFTKLIGVIVLNFAHSEIFQIYYFRMYLSIVILGAAHGLLFLPALLALVGPQSSASKEDEDEVYSEQIDAPHNDIHNVSETTSLR